MAFGQGVTGQAPANIDSLVAAAKAAARKVTYRPSYRGSIVGNVTFMEMRNQYQSTTSTRWGEQLLTLIRHGRKNYRLQNRFEENRLFKNALNQRFAGVWSVDLSYDDSRQFNRAITTGGLVNDFIKNDRGVTLTLWRQSAAGHALRWDGRTAASTTVGKKTFQTDNARWAAANGGARYQMNVLGRPVHVSARAAHKETWMTTTSLSGRDVFALASFADATFHRLGGSEDSVVTSMVAVMHDSTVVRAGYSEFTGIRRYADQARGALGAQKFNESALLWERERKRTESITAALISHPLKGVKLTGDLIHSINGADYANQDTRFSETTTDRIGASVQYTAPWGTHLSSRFQNGVVNRNLGPKSLGSFREQRRRFDVSGNHSLTPNVGVNLAYSTQLAQSFYKSAENPRDRDQLDQSITASANGAVGQNIDARFSFTFNQTQFINIDASQSSDNRTKERLSVGPNLTFRISPLLVVEQSYSVSVERTTYAAMARQGDNTLDRNLDFSNRFRLTFSERVTGSLEYRLNRHDRGAAVGRNGDVLIPDREDRRDQMFLGVKYRVLPHVSWVTNFDYNRKADRTIGVGSVASKTTAGGIEAGFEGNFKWGTGRTMRVELKKANRFSPFNTARQNDFWVMNTTVEYAF